MVCSSRNKMIKSIEMTNYVISSMCLSDCQSSKFFNNVHQLSKLDLFPYITVEDKFQINICGYRLTALTDWVGIIVIKCLRLLNKIN